MPNTPTGTTRRQFLAGSTAVVGGAFIAGVAGCSGTSPGSSSKQLVYAGFGGTYDADVLKYMYKPFEKQTGISITMTADAPDPIAPIQAQVKSGHPEWDYMILNTGTLAESINLNLLQKVDYSKIPNAQYLALPGYHNPYGPSLWVFCENICWNTRFVKGPINSWEDFWDIQRFPGKRCLPGDTDTIKTLAIALLADGVEPTKLFPLDIERALASLDRVKSSTVFLDVDTETNQIAQQDVVMALQNYTRIKVAIQGGIPLAYSWNQYITDVSTYGLLRGAAHSANYYSLYNFILSDPMQRLQPTVFGYAPVTKPALAQIPASLASNLPLSTVTEAGAIQLNAYAIQWAAQADEATSALTTWQEAL